MTDPTVDSQTNDPSAPNGQVPRTVHSAHSAHSPLTDEQSEVNDGRSKNSSGAKVGWVMQLLGAGLLLLSLAMFAAWAVRLFGGTQASRVNAALGAITFGVWVLLGSVFLGVGTFIRRTK